MKLSQAASKVSVQVPIPSAVETRTDCGADVVVVKEGEPVRSDDWLPISLKNEDNLSLPKNDEAANQPDPIISAVVSQNQQLVASIAKIFATLQSHVQQADDDRRQFAEFMTRSVDKSRNHVDESTGKTIDDQRERPPVAPVRASRSKRLTPCGNLPTSTSLGENGCEQLPHASTSQMPKVEVGVSSSDQQVTPCMPTIGPRQTLSQLSKAPRAETAVFKVISRQSIAASADLQPKASRSSLCGKSSVSHRPEKKSSKVKPREDVGQSKSRESLTPSIIEERSDSSPTTADSSDNKLKIHCGSMGPVEVMGGHDYRRNSEKSPSVAEEDTVSDFAPDTAFPLEEDVSSDNSRVYGTPWTEFGQSLLSMSAGKSRRGSSQINTSSATEFRDNMSESASKEDLKTKRKRRQKTVPKIEAVLRNSASALSQASTPQKVARLSTKNTRKLPEKRGQSGPLSSPQLDQSSGSELDESSPRTKLTKNGHSFYISSSSSGLTSDVLGVELGDRKSAEDLATNALRVDGLDRSEMACQTSSTWLVKPECPATKVQSNPPTAAPRFTSVRSGASTSKKPNFDATKALLAPDVFRINISDSTMVDSETGMTFHPGQSNSRGINGDSMILEEEPEPTRLDVSQCKTRTKPTVYMIRAPDLCTIPATNWILLLLRT